MSRAVTDGLAVKILSDTPAGDVLYRYRIGKASFAQRQVSPLNKRGHDLSTKALPVNAFLEPQANLGRSRIRIFQRSHANAFANI